MQMLVLLAALALLPMPKEVETTGGTRSLSSVEIVRAVAAFEQDAAIPKEGYRLVVDERGVRAAAYGATAGTVKGFALAEDCEIEVTGIPKGVTSFEVPLNFEGAAPEDAEWTVKDGEKVSRRFEAVARDGKLTLIRRGSLIILR